jgi:hypothetical protein
MATTDSGFTFRYNLAGRSSGIRRSYIIANSQTITIGDMVRLTAGFAALAGAATTIMGVIVGLEDAKGLDLENARATLTNAAYTASTKTVVAASDNQTVDAVRAIVDIDPFSVYSAQPDGTMAATTGSNLIGYYCDLISASDQPDETDTVTTKQQLFIWGLDPENTNRGLYSIAEHQIWGY